jgi:hypothetical protein
MEATFEYLGIVSEFGKKYNVIDIYWDKSEFVKTNIPIYLITRDQLTIQILCTKNLSHAIKNGERQLDQIWDNMVIRKIKEDGNSILRISAVVISRFV